MRPKMLTKAKYKYKYKPPLGFSSSSSWQLAAGCVQRAVVACCLFPALKTQKALCALNTKHFKH
jgi:hypothetical protein